MNKTSLLAALLGLALGVGATRVPALVADGQVLESDLPEGELDGLTSAQKRAVLQAANETPFECGIPAGTYASCRAKHPALPRTKRAFELATQLARSGADADAIGLAIGRMPTAATAPMPAARLRDGAKVEHEEIHVHEGADGKK